MRHNERDSKGRFCKLKSVEGFKAFNADFTCLNKQYKVGKTYTEDGMLGICSKGMMHFCENPLDVFRYYSPYRLSRFAKVVGSGKVQRSENKTAATTLTINNEISLADLISSTASTGKNVCQSTEYLVLHSPYSEVISDEVYSVAKQDGYDSIAIAKNYGSIAYCASARSISITERIGSLAFTSSYDSIAITKSSESTSLATGEHSIVIAKAQYNAYALCKGKSSIAIAQEVSVNTFLGYNFVEAAVAGSVAMADGRNVAARGVKGALLIFIRRDRKGNVEAYKMCEVDGKEVREDTFYMLLDDNKLYELATFAIPWHIRNRLKTKEEVNAQLND